MPLPTEASSAAIPADVKQGSGNLTQGQAAAKLFATEAKTETAKPPQTAPGKTAPEKSDIEETPLEDAPDAEVEAPSVEPEPEEEPGNAVDTSAPPEKTEDEADPDVHSHSTSFTPEQQKIFDKRLGKEIGKRSALETKLAEAEAKLTEKEAARANAPVPPIQSVPSNQPLGDIHDMAALGAHQAKARQAVRWADETLDSPKSWKTRVDTDPETGEETSVRVTYIGDKAYTESEVKGIMRNAKVTLEDEIPQRANWINARTHASQAAHQEFPFLVDKKSPEYAQAQQMLRDPWLQMRPDAEWIAGVQVRGLSAMSAAKAAAKAAEGKPKVKAPAAKPSSDQAAVSSTAAPARAPLQSGQRAALAAENARMKAKGGVTQAEAVASLMNRERIRNSR